MFSHDRANKQAEMDVSPAMGDMLTEMQGCLKQLCGDSAVRDPEAVAQLIYGGIERIDSNWQICAEAVANEGG